MPASPSADPPNTDHSSQRTLRLDGSDGTHELVLRPLTSADDYALGETLQRATWGDGEDFDELASATMMLISQKVGGIAAGAFDTDGGIRGFVFGLTGLRHGQLTHWSHMLAVDPTLGGLGLGRHLKEYQRDELLALGVHRMLWTYDPLVARNAHLNLNRLHAEPVEYHVNLYGDGAQNALHRGLGTDRFIVEWRLDEPAPVVPAGDGATEAPRLNSDASGAPRTDDFPLPEVPAVRVEIPYDIQELKAEDGDAARAWRAATRRPLVHYLERGYRIRRLLRDGQRCDYLLETAAEGVSQGVTEA